LLERRRCRVAADQLGLRPRRSVDPDRFQRGDLAIRVLEATDDGSRGRRGRVTELAAEALSSGAAAMYACGPNVMLQSLAIVLEGAAVAPKLTEASFEAPMGCGFGTCLGCALPVRDGAGDVAWALCCTNGPVLSMRDISWPDLAALPPASVA